MLRERHEHSPPVQEQRRDSGDQQPRIAEGLGEQSQLGRRKHVQISQPPLFSLRVNHMPVLIENMDVQDVWVFAIP
jgi:hypothetical protein